MIANSFFLLILQCLIFVPEVKCGHPAIPLNARVSLSSPGLAPGTVATYKCDEGYETFGNTEISCSPSGKWIGELPFCGEQPFLPLSTFSYFRFTQLPSLSLF
jgi:hypothetical protein